MKYPRNKKIAGIFIALLLALGGCSSNAVPTTSPVKVDAPKQSQTQEQPNETAVKDTSPTPAATPPTAAPAVGVAPTPTVVAPTPTPVALPVVTPAPAPKQAPQAVTVYVTNTGKKYHRDGCRYLSQSRIPISLSDAKSGYGPCSVCNPPQ